MLQPELSSWTDSILGYSWQHRRFAIGRCRPASAVRILTLLCVTENGFLTYLYFTQSSLYKTALSYSIYGQCNGRWRVFLHRILAREEQKRSAFAVFFKPVSHPILVSVLILLILKSTEKWEPLFILMGRIQIHFKKALSYKSSCFHLGMPSPYFDFLCATSLSKNSNR